MNVKLTYIYVLFHLQTTVKENLKHALGQLIAKDNWLHSFSAQSLVIHPNYTGLGTSSIHAV